MTEDVSQHEFLTLRLRLGGDPATHNTYFCNIQTDGPFETDLWQHRLFFKRRDGGWEDIYVGLKCFFYLCSVFHPLPLLSDSLHEFCAHKFGGAVRRPDRDKQRKSP